MADKLRLGGMALRNGVLVHGPTSFGVAVRRKDGSIATASGPVPRVSRELRAPVLRGPVRLAESLARINHFLRLIPDPVQPAAPAGQPTGLAVWMVGSALCSGAGSSGLEP